MVRKVLRAISLGSECHTRVPDASRVPLRLKAERSVCVLGGVYVIGPPTVSTYTSPYLIKTKGKKVDLTKFQKSISISRTLKCIKEDNYFFQHY